MSLRQRAQRLPWIDMLRGLATCFVLISHLNHIPTLYSHASDPIMIPLFFAISGYLFHETQEAKQFFLNLLTRMVIPLFIISLFPVKVLYDMARGNFSTVLFRLNQVLSGYNLWYISCAIVASILFYFILKLCKNRLWLIATVCCVVAVAGFLMAAHHICDYGKVNTACIAQLYLLLGYCLKHRQVPPMSYVCLLGVIYVALLVVTQLCTAQRAFDCAINYYFNYPIVLSMILTGNLALFFGVRKLAFPRPIVRIFSFIGENSLTFYAFHVYCFHAVRRLPWVSDSGLGETVVLFCGAAMCSVLSVLINRYAPFLVGKRKA